MLVLDASAAICLLLNDPPERAAVIRLRLRDEDIHAPHLIDVEIAHTLRRFVLTRQLGADEAGLALTDLLLLPLIRRAHYPWLDRVWELRPNLTAYDASYVALAELLDAPLITLDARLARAGAGARVTFEVF